MDYFSQQPICARGAVCLDTPPFVSCLCRAASADGLRADTHVRSLRYTGFVVPVVIAFFWDNPDPCWKNPLIPFDIFVDTFFLCEILFNFRKGTHIKVSSATCLS